MGAALAALAEFTDAQPAAVHTRAEARGELPPEGGTL